MIIFLHLWTIKTPTCRRDISHKVTVTKIILNDRWCKIGILNAKGVIISSLGSDTGSPLKALVTTLAHSSIASILISTSSAFLFSSVDPYAISQFIKFSIFSFKFSCYFTCTLFNGF